MCSFRVNPTKVSALRTEFLNEQPNTSASSSLPRSFAVSVRYRSDPDAGTTSQEDLVFTELMCKLNEMLYRDSEVVLLATHVTATIPPGKSRFCQYVEHNRTTVLKLCTIIIKYLLFGDGVHE